MRIRGRFGAKWSDIAPALRAERVDPEPSDHAARRRAEARQRTAAVRQPHRGDLVVREERGASLLDAVASPGLFSEHLLAGGAPDLDLVIHDAMIEQPRHTENMARRWSLSALLNARTAIMLGTRS